MSKSTLGDKYIDELKYLKDELDKVKAAQARNPRPFAQPTQVTPRAVTWGLGSINFAPPVPQVTPSVPGTLETLVANDSSVGKSIQECGRIYSKY
jgi:hypothetical protein